MTPYGELTVAFYTLGCKLNFSESSAIARSFRESGYSVVDFEAGADIYILNTCSVTEQADKKCRALVNKVKRLNADAKVVVIGCYAQLKPKEIVELPGVDMVLGASEKFNMLDHIHQLMNAENPLVIAGEIEEIDFFAPAWSAGDRTRTFLKVQDGCDYSCTFCTIPLARGNSRSPSIDSILNEVEKIAAQGVKEIVLTGVNTGDFGIVKPGSKKRETTFLELIKALDRVNGIDRFRISSIEPNLLHDEIVRFVAYSEKFVPHFHIPLQSGSDKMLRKMRRRYLSDLYKNRVETILAEMPDCCIGVDVITGFPGESQEDFLETYQFLNELPVSYLHVFTYSERPNTPAAEMDEAIPYQERKQRTHQLRSLSEKKKRAFYQRFSQTERPVLWEAEQNGDLMFGYTDNYIRVQQAYQEEKVNLIETVMLDQMDSKGIMLVHEPEKV